MALAARALLLGLMALSAASVAGRARKPSGSSRGTGSTPAGRAGPRAPPDRATLLALRSLIERADQLDQAERKPEPWRSTARRWRCGRTLRWDTYFNLALCLQESGRLLEAHSHFSRTLALLPR